MQGIKKQISYQLSLKYSCDVLNVYIMEDTDRNGLFHEIGMINRSIKNVTEYTTLLLICRSCGNIVIPHSQPNSFNKSKIKRSI